MEILQAVDVNDISAVTLLDFSVSNGRTLAAISLPSIPTLFKNKQSTRWTKPYVFFKFNSCLYIYLNVLFGENEELVLPNCCYCCCCVVVVLRPR